MIEPEWMKFESTGSVTDYLSYKGHVEGGATWQLKNEVV